MSSDVVFEEKLFRDVALVAPANRARVRIVAGVRTNVDPDVKNN